MSTIGLECREPLRGTLASGVYIGRIFSILGRQCVTTMTIDASKEKQKPISVHVVLNFAGLCLVNAGLYAFSL